MKNNKEFSKKDKNKKIKNTLNVKSEKEKNKEQKNKNTKSKNTNKKSKGFILNAFILIIIVCLAGYLIYTNLSFEVKNDSEKETIISDMFKADKEFKSKDNFSMISKNGKTGEVYSSFEKNKDKYLYTDEISKIWGDLGIKKITIQSKDSKKVADLSSIINLYSSLSINPYSKFESYISNGPYKTKIYKKGGSYIIHLDLNGNSSDLYISKKTMLPERYDLLKSSNEDSKEPKVLNFNFSKGKTKEESVKIPKDVLDSLNKKDDSINDEKDSEADKNE